MFTREPFGMHRQSSTSSAFVPQTPHHQLSFFDDTLDLRRKGKRSFSERKDESATSGNSSTNASAPFNPNNFFDFTSSSTTTTSSTLSSAPTIFDPNNLF